MKPSSLLALAPALVSVPAFAQGGTDLQTGGLAPPAPVETAPSPVAPSETEQTLSRADREDSGRGLEFVWLNAEIGAQHLGLATFHDDEFVDGEYVKSKGTGLAYGVGAGVRLIFITLGARFRLGNFETWRLWTLNAEAGLRIPLGALEPYFTFGGGYASLGAFEPSGDSFRNSGIAWKDLSGRGFNLRGSAGLDYYIGHTLSIGANLSGDILFLSRKKVSLPATLQALPPGAEIYGADGSSIGGATTLTAVAGLHF